MTENNGGVWQKKVMSEKSGVITQGRKEMEVGTLLLGNDKNNVIVNYLLSYLSKGLSEVKHKLKISVFHLF